RTTNVYAITTHQSSPSAWLTIVGRLRSDSSTAQAAARVQALLGAPAGRNSAQYGAVPLNAAALPASARSSIRQFARLLAATVALLVLVGCVSVATLLLIRTEARRS